MAFKEFLTVAKEIATEVNGLLKVVISTVGLLFVAVSVYKQVNTIKEVTPTSVIETVCGGEVIDSLNLASKLADPATGAVIEELLAGCQKIKTPEPDEPDQVQFPTPLVTDLPVAKETDTRALNAQ